MIDVDQEAAVIAERLQRPGPPIVALLHPERLDGHRPRQVQVLGQPDLAEGPGPEELVGAVSEDRKVGHRRAGWDVLRRLIVKNAPAHQALFDMRLDPVVAFRLERAVTNHVTSKFCAGGTTGHGITSHPLESSRDLTSC